MDRQSADRESKYTQLLQPIRDLTKNWDVDVASQLEEYLLELEQISIGFEGSNNKMNFAEAALVIQGSACVYSRKVEYLYALVYQALELMASKKKLTQSSSVDNQGKDTDASFAQKQDNQFLTLDDIREATNIDMIETHTPNKSLTCTTVLRTPMTLIPLHDSEKLTSTPLYSHNGELLGNKLNYKLNSSTIHKSGFLLLEPIKQLINEGHVDLKDNGQVEDVGGDVGGVMDDFNNDDVMESSFHDDANHTPFRFSPEEKRTEDMQLRLRPRVKLADTKEVESHGWKKLDPHVATKTAIKPFKKGKTQRLPHTLKSSNTRKRKGSCSNPPPSKSVAQFLFDSFYTYSSLFPKNKLLCPTSTEFEQHYWNEYKRRKSQKTKLTKRFKRNVSEKEDIELEEDEDVEDDHYEPLGENRDQLVTPLPCDNGDLFEGVEPMALDDSLSTEQDGIQDTATAANVAQTYEELVRHFVSNALNLAAAHATETELTKRVREWEERMKPRLLAEEQQPVFDIHQYSEHIIDVLKLHEESEDVPFTEIVSGKDPHEICRIFTASLQLANDYNVDIITASVSNSSDKDIDTICLRLLSTELHHKEVANYRVPSQQSRSDHGASRKRNRSNSLEQIENKSKR